MRFASIMLGKTRPRECAHLYDYVNASLVRQSRKRSRDADAASRRSTVRHRILLTLLQIARPLNIARWLSETRPRHPRNYFRLWARDGFPEPLPQTRPQSFL